MLDGEAATTTTGEDHHHTLVSYSLEQVLEAATVLLHAQQQQRDANISDISSFPQLCHPTSHNFEPYVPHCQNSYHDENDDVDSSRRMRFLLSPDHDDWEFYLTNVGGAMVCIAAVALIAGLFLGYLTLDAFDLRIVERASLVMEEREYARTILPIVVERHRVLVTLLILNGLAYETLPLFLDNLVPSWAAILLSVTFIMVFGEIIPSGIFTGPRQLYLGYCMAPLMNFLLWITYPFAKPLALILDHLVHQGTDPADDEGYNRGELSALVRIQHEQDTARIQGLASRSAHWSTKTPLQSSAVTPQRKVFSTSSTPNWADVKQELLDRVREKQDRLSDHHRWHSDPNDLLQQYHYKSNHHITTYTDEESYVASVPPPLHPTEVDVIEGALQMKTILVMDVLTPLNKVYAIPKTLTLDKSNICSIYGQGFSRVPVFDPDPEDDMNQTRVLGFLLVRQLILVDWDHNREVSTLPLQRPGCVSPRMNLVDLLRTLQSEGPIMTFVCARPDLANRALDKEVPIPPEAGFMGIVTLEDIMESILQEKIYDEQDIRDRDRAVATLTRWAATKLQDFYRRKKKQRQSSFSSTSSGMADERTPLLASIAEGYPSSNEKRRRNGDSSNLV